MLSTLEFVITGCFQGLRVYSALKRGPQGPPLPALLPPKVPPFPAWTRWAQALSRGLQIQLNPSLCHLPEAPTCIFYNFWHISSLSDILQCIPPPPILFLSLVKNVPERSMCPWVVLYYWWFHLSYLISPPDLHLNSLRTETTPSALLQFPQDQGQSQASSRPLANACWVNKTMNEWNNRLISMFLH